MDNQMELSKAAGKAIHLDRDGGFEGGGSDARVVSSRVGCQAYIAGMCQAIFVV